MEEMSESSGEFLFDDEGYVTHTSKVQIETEKVVLEAIANNQHHLQGLTLLTKDYLKNGLIFGLDSNFSSLDASRPWLCYWMVHSLLLLGEELSESLVNKVIFTLKLCRDNELGGYGGGYLQMPHTAPTYASVMTLISLNSNQAFLSIERGHIYRFFLSLKDEKTGGFRLHKDGECDSRGMYTVLAVASLLNILTKELIENCAEWIHQEYDGGIGGESGNESHGGYAYCGLASLVILNRPDRINLDRFAHWLFMRQMSCEGGFQGRANKLVDSCYSFWQGASFALLQRLDPTRRFPTCNSDRLIEYVIGACVALNGGLKDKPRASRDYYHTCYALSGVSVLNSNSTHHLSSLVETDPVYNICVNKLGKARAFFSRLPNEHGELLDLI